MNAPVMIGPVVEHFIVQIPTGFTPTDVDGDGADKNASGKVCPGYTPPDYRPRWGGGFLAPRGPERLAHRAIDIMAAEGALVCAPAPCTIERVELTPKGGHCLYLRDERGWVWYFGHMRDTPLVLAGEIVEAGHVLGFVGRTGNAVRTYATAEGKVRRGCPHLHASLTRPRGSSVRAIRELGAEVRGEKVDPVPFLRRLYAAGGWRRARLGP